ncbi:hypothetical protein AAFF_G00009720 [Aldrovandia affinis]|uniref:A disintegrin and metalloproteinase with thrombospondin motifs 12 n=1 Tax=Aldrovandia affinis TaxID=143900 RepID=A0AAD7S745_9TELE|nr:hypothetical protein AAFF_G00009720 [Aldrovandia affinis]
MQCLLESRVLFLLQLIFFLATGHVEFFQSDNFQFPDTEQDRFIRSHTEFSVVHPEKVSRDGEFVSFTLTHYFNRGRNKRDLGPSEKNVYYKVKFGGWNLIFNLTVNNHLLSNQYVLERRPGVFNGTQQQVSRDNGCHLIGRVTNSSVQGTAAVSTCKGLKGFFSLSNVNFFIEPVRGYEANGDKGFQPHVIYRSSAGTMHHRHRRGAESEGKQSVCGLKDTMEESFRVEREREEWEQEQMESGRPRRISPRSVSRERWVETMVVADSKLIEYHGSDNVESYIFTIMNMVTGIFHDASIGNAIHIILVRLILLQEDEKGLKIVHHADSTLSSFCTWQKNVNPQSDTHPAHHDVAVLITRKDICAGMNRPCETLGLSHLSGMCQPHRSCNINEDSGLPVAFTVAHELGHSFGIHHDGQGNDCELDGRHPFIMSRQLKYDTSPLTWSPCSKEYITRFLDRGWGFCLDDRPSKKDLTTPLAAPGVRYSTHHQCQLQYGPNATFCEEVENVCQILWCYVNSSCRSKLDSPADGTRCGQDKWCISGECVIVGKLPETINGGWGMWSTWTHCSRTCGAGVQAAERECNKPKPEFGGKYCTGERKRYRVCNTKPCAKQRPTFREMQCSEFDTVLYQNELYDWVPVPNTVSPCELHCRPVDEQFSEKMLDAVTDGTPCFMNNSRSICVNGVCKEVGCDYGIDSNAVEDRCGVCLGDGTACQTVHKNFDNGEGFGYVDVGLIPEGARDILVQEVQESGNFLVLRGQDPEEYYLNGRYIIQWNGEYKAGGATFLYERIGNLENLTSTGPTREPIMIQLLFQEKNPGIKYEYTIKKNRQRGNEVIEPEYRWKNGAWTDCSTSCGTGVQHQPVRCFEVEVGVVEESLCDLEHRQKTDTANARKWTVLRGGGWAAGSRAQPPASLLKPKAVVACNRDLPCGSDWAVGPWSECPMSCGGGVRSRTVTCVTAPKVRCNISTKPRSKSLCALQSCPSSPRRKVFRVFPKVTTVKPDTQSWGPFHSPATVAPLTTTTTTTTTITTTTATIKTITTSAAPSTTTSIPTSTSYSTDSDIIDPEDYEFNFIVVNNGSTKDKGGVTPIANPTSWDSQENDVTEEGEGSTPDFLLPDTEIRYTPGYDYVVGDIEEEVPGKFPVTTRAPLSVTTATPLHHITSRVTLTTPALHTSTARWARTPGQYHRTSPKTTPFIKPDTKWRPKTTSATRTTQRSHPNSTEMGSTTKSLFPTVSTTVVPRKSRTTPQPKGRGPRLGTPVSYTSNDENLDAKPTNKTDVSWIVGNWSECSTSCGMGAVWRTVLCSSPEKSDCTNINKPEPARRCHLRPCAIWHSGNWSKCPEGCLGGVKQRDVQCIDGQNKRHLRPFHCQALAYKPVGSLPCAALPCVDWHSSPWGQCSKSCGEGLRERLVYCPEYNRCNPAQRPNTTELCNQHPCSLWDTKDWEECTVSCGGGVQHRVVKCVNKDKETGDSAGQCDKSTRPDSFQKCNLQECKRKLVPWCNKNSMSTRFCEKLKLLGRCSLSSIRKQCCATCAGLKELIEMNKVDNEEYFLRNRFQI